MAPDFPVNRDSSTTENMPSQPSLSPSRFTSETFCVRNSYTPLAISAACFGVRVFTSVSLQVSSYLRLAQLANAKKAAIEATGLGAFRRGFQIAVKFDRLAVQFAVVVVVGFGGDPTFIHLAVDANQKLLFDRCLMRQERR